MKSLLAVFVLYSLTVFSQPPASPAEEVLTSVKTKGELEKSSILKNIALENIGPTIMSGRVTDLDVNPENPKEFYVGYATGGLWYTDNNGTTFTPVLDSAPTQNIGDIAVDWSNHTIWVGTGENNSSRSSYAGIGMLKSVDQGATWEHVGLWDSHHIGRILLNPNDPENVVVGVTGHLYSPNRERGVFRTTDGGKTWEQTLFINEDTGIIDLAYAPGNFNIQYAAAWQKDRKAWNFTGNGSGSGIYKSSDGGKTWALVSGAGSGFPAGEGVGRIGLAVFDENTVYAVHDNQDRRAPSEEEKKGDELEKDDLREISTEAFLKLDDQKLTAFLKNNRFPKKYDAEKVKAMVRSKEITPLALVQYLEDANSLLFDTPVIGAEVYRSTEAGENWVKMNEDYIDDLYFSYGYYFGQINVDPNDKDRIYLAGVPIITSADGGKTFKSINGDNVHADHHALWINPADSQHLVNGNDGGVNISFDGGENWIKNNSPSVGQFYDINIDYQKPYNVYGGLQDNGVWKGPHNATENSRWHQTGHYPWKSIMGGDGMQTEIDRRNPNVVYTGLQFGNYYRLNLADDSRKFIQPKHELGETPYRFNWQTPILLSSHNQDILYLGSNKLHRSLNQGDDWEAISGDLTLGGKKGNVSFGTLTTIAESPFKFGLLYTGSDDGLIHTSKDGGGNWNLITNGLPRDLWVSRVVASSHEKSRVYAALNGYRWDDFNPYIYRSDDYGQTWTAISQGIPLSPVNAFVEDPVNENLLFAGTDNGLYASFDRGENWELFQNGIPNVAVHDLVIQSEENHLLVGTHGRSIYKADITPLQNLDTRTMNKPLHIFAIGDIDHSDRWGDTFWSWGEASTPGIDVVFWSSGSGDVVARVLAEGGIAVSETTIQAEKGLNVLSYDVAFSKKGKAAYLKKFKTALKEAQNGKTYLPAGSYTLEIANGNDKEVKGFKIK